MKCERNAAMARAEKAERERDAALAERDGTRGLLEVATETVDALTRERDAAIARADELETALERAKWDFTDIDDLGGSGRTVAIAARNRAERALRRAHGRRQVKAKS